MTKYFISQNVIICLGGSSKKLYNREYGFHTGNDYHREVVEDSTSHLRIIFWGGGSQNTLSKQVK